MLSFIDFCRENQIEFFENEPMSRRTSFKAGGNSRCFVVCKNETELSKVLKTAKELKIDTFILGLGSNVLFSDEGFNGAVITLQGDFEKIEVENNIITVGAGLSLAKLANVARDNSLTGLEFSFGIPGTVGGAVFMNAGAYGGEIKDVIKSVRAMDKQGNIKTYSYEALKLSYRNSIFHYNDEIILSAEFQLNEGEREEISAKMMELLNRRKDKQPLEYPSAGSTFKRPEGYFAAPLIEECGLKGCSVGGAEVSRKHSGFIINKNKATATDILNLVDEVKKRVKNEKGVNLECEIIIVGGK